MNQPFRAENVLLVINSRKVLLLKGEGHKLFFSGTLPKTHGKEENSYDFPAMVDHM